MATVRWQGRAQKQAQVNTITPANVAVGNTFTVTINSKSITFTATAGTVANVTAGLVALLQASEDGEFQEITWKDNTTNITGTAVMTGKPFTQTSSATGGTATLTTSTTTANISPNDVNNGTNWSTGSVPVGADDVIFDEGGVDALYNLGALSAVTLTSLTIRKGYKGKIGLPERNTDGTEYFEYRATEFAISATTVTIEQDGHERDQIKLNVAAAACTLVITGAGKTAIGEEQLRWRGTNAGNVINCQGGSVAVAPLAGTSATVATIRADGSTIYLGPSVTLTTINGEDSTIESLSNITTLNQKGDASETTIKDSVTIGTATIDDGRLISYSTGTITTLTLGTGAVFEKLDNRAQTITNLVEMHAGSSIIDPSGSLTLSAGFRPNRCKLEELESVNFGYHRTFTVA